MGDICDMNDLERFARSTEGQAHLDGIRRMLKGRTIVDVRFSNEVHFIATTLHLDDGGTFPVMQPFLEVEAIREQFREVIEREYYLDFPERKPDTARPEMGPQRASKHSRLIPVTKWNEYHEWPPIGGLRHLIFYAETNGFDKVIRRAGRRVLIDEDAFFEWVKTREHSV